MQGGPLAAGGDAHVMERLDIRALARAVFVHQHALAVEAQDLPAGLGQRLVGADSRNLLLSRCRFRRRAVQLGERPLELGLRLGLEVVRRQCGADGAEIIHRARRRELDLDLAAYPLAAANVGLDGIERQDTHVPFVLLHDAVGAALADDKQLGEGLPVAQASHDLARGTGRPIVRGRIRRDLALMLFPPMHRALGFAQSLDGQQPAIVPFPFTQPARVAAAQEVAVRRVQVVVDHMPLALGAERIPAQRLELEQGGEHRRVSYRVLGFGLRRRCHRGDRDRSPRTGQTGAGLRCAAALTILQQPLCETSGRRTRAVTRSPGSWESFSRSC